MGTAIRDTGRISAASKDAKGSVIRVNSIRRAIPAAPVGAHWLQQVFVVFLSRDDPFNWTSVSCRLMSLGWHDRLRDVEPKLRSSIFRFHSG